LRDPERIGTTRRIARRRKEEEIGYGEEDVEEGKKEQGQEKEEVQDAAPLTRKWRAAVIATRHSPFQ
jgi:hypothetical protein